MNLVPDLREVIQYVDDYVELGTEMGGWVEEFWVSGKL